MYTCHKGRKHHILQANPQCSSIRRWGLRRRLGHEGRALMNGISALNGRGPRELVHAFCYVRIQLVGTIYEAEKDPSPNLKSCDVLILDFPASAFLLFISYPV